MDKRLYILIVIMVTMLLGTLSTSAERYDSTVAAENDVKQAEEAILNTYQSGVYSFDETSTYNIDTSSEINKLAYDNLLPFVRDVAEGRRTSTEFEINAQTLGITMPISGNELPNGNIYD